LTFSSLNKKEKIIRLYNKNNRKYRGKIPFAIDSFVFKQFFILGHIPSVKSSASGKKRPVQKLADSRLAGPDLFLFVFFHMREKFSGKSTEIRQGVTKIVHGVI
jgi:hypothetical protein